MTTASKPSVIAQGNEKKRHHYVPVTYLNRFADTSGRVFAYRKDDSPSPPLHIRASEIAFERYYYSQPLPAGGQDNNRLEDLFADVENKWPSLVEDLTARRAIGNRAEALFHFVSLLRVRGPAARDPIELFYAHLARRQLEILHEAGELPPPPLGITLDDIEIAIDPHRSIHAMSDMLRGLGLLWDQVGIEVVHNATSEPFATSDNPVVYFDPDVPEDRLLPYTIRLPSGRVELFVTISPTVMLRGRTEIPVNRLGQQLRHVEITSRSEVCRVNRLIARFGYRFVFASHDRLQKMVTKYAALSPTVRFTDSINEEGNAVLSQMMFARRPQKPKWRSRKEGS